MAYQRGITHAAAISTHPSATTNEAKRLVREALSDPPIIDMLPERDQPALGPLPQPESNVFSIGNIKFEAFGDRLIVLEDEFKTGYECSVCGGSGHRHCLPCDGKGTRQSVKGEGPFKKCSDCDGKGSTVCSGCNGKGGLIIAPDVAQRRPTTGKVVSAGKGKIATDTGKLIPMQIRVGDSVMYSNFSGYVVDLESSGRPICLRIIHESEVLCRMEGNLTLSSLRGKSDIATFQS